ncbi:MAG: hypothetical protein J0I77_00530 [Rudaea sp.]|uniref:hypothetical protein n=1 Tax=unclassified Rudaea TaxID=2627037 RepID=UPI0010F93DB9|nr:MULTISPECIES: hypothetical protein [unclassified Rudaea]MBN8884178.1 hypothetical protein [Rudaea sp.]
MDFSFSTITEFIETQQAALADLPLGSVMKIIASLFSILFIFSIFLYISGSDWILKSNKEINIYGRAGEPISQLPVVGVVKDGELISVSKCYFDKNDAYLNITKSDGANGYIFDHNQRFIHFWKMGKVSFATFPIKYDCWRLVSQFGI